MYKLAILLMFSAMGCNGCYRPKPIKVDIEGVLISETTNKPASVVKIQVLSEECNRFGSDGSFLIEDVSLPPRSKQLTLIIYFNDQTVKEEKIDIDPTGFDRSKGLLSLGIVKVPDPSSSPSPPPPVPPGKNIAQVVTERAPLVLRSLPRIGNNKKGLIPKGAYVEILFCQEQEIELSGKKGKWCKIRYGIEEGYVFDAYLRRVK